MQVVNDCNIFARASPENKLRIVRALQTGPGYPGAMDGEQAGEQAYTLLQSLQCTCSLSPGGQ